MARCLTNLNEETNQGVLNDLLRGSDFASNLRNYYRGNLDQLPTIDSLVKELNEDILPAIIEGKLNKDYDYSDIKETINNELNSEAINLAIAQLKGNMRKFNLTVRPILPKFDIVSLLLADIDKKEQGDVASTTQKVVEASKLNDATPLDIATDTSLSEYIHENNYQNLKAYRLDRFKGSSSMEKITVSKFITKGLIETAFIDVNNRVLVNQLQGPAKEGYTNDVDTNIKNYRISLFKDLIGRLGIEETVKGETVPLIYRDDLLKKANFDKTLKDIANRATIIKYNGEQRSLTEPNLLSEITEKFKDTLDSNLKEIIDNFSDYVILSDFNKLFNYYGEGTISVNKFNPDFDPILRKYETKDALSVDAFNVSWDEKIQNGVELSSPFYKTVINNTAILNYNTGDETGKYLYPTLVTSIMAPYFNQIDRNDVTNSLRQLIMDRIGAQGIGYTEKNTLYTLYKKFFEREGDVLNTPAKNDNTTVASFYETIKDNRDQTLMQLITKPISEMSPNRIAEAVEAPNGDIRLKTAEANNKSSVGFTSTRFINDHINMSNEDLQNFLKKWNISFINEKGKPSTVNYTGQNGIDYVLKNTNNQIVDIDTIQQLSQDLFGFDYKNDKRHAEFWQEVQSLSRNDEPVASPFLTYIKDALDIVQAKSKLNDPEFQTFLRTEQEKQRKKGGDIETNYKPINDAIKKEGAKFPFSDPSNYKFELNNINATDIGKLIVTAENNATGNQRKSVVSTVDGTSSAAFTNYTYAAALQQNFTAHRRTLNSAIRPDIDKSPLHNNIILNDANFLKGFPLRGATKVGATVKPVGSQTPLETLHYDINLGYLSMLQQGIDGGHIRPTFNLFVPADKSNQPLAEFGNEVLIPSQGRVKLFVDDNNRAPSYEQSMDLLYKTNGQYYRAQGQSILDTWEQVYRVSGHGSVFESNIKSKGSISKQLIALNDFHKDGFWKTGTFEHGLKDLNAARFYANKAGVVLTNWVHYINDTKSFGPKTRLEIKGELIDNISHYEGNPNKTSESFKVKYNKQLVNFANDLREIGFTFDPLARETITRLYHKLGGEFGNKANMFITSSNIEAKKFSDIHPAIIKYFWDHNLLEQNLMHASVGDSSFYKGNNENTSWLTNIKRNVCFTATIRPFSLGLETGVEDHTRTAFVDDMTSMFKGILGDSSQVVDWDGASLKTMTQCLKTWNSLNGKFNGNGGTTHKPFISHYDPTTAHFGITKFADFTMTNDLIRQTIGSNVDLMELHKQLYATDISNVDITKSWKDGVNLSTHNDVYYYKRGIDFETGLYGTLHKLDSITFLAKDIDGKSKYIVTTRNMSIAPDKPVSKPMQINTMFDLWHILGGIDSVEHTDLETQFHYRDGDTKLYLTGNYKSAEKLLEYESYIGNKGETIIPESYVSGNDNVKRGYQAYKQLFNDNGLVSSHINLIDKYTKQPINESQLALEIGQHDIKTKDPKEFITILNQYKDNLQDLVEYANKGESQLSRPYQRFKGKNIDRITFAGAQKVGQFNMNNIETVHLKKRSDFLQGKEDPGIPGVTRLITHQVSNFNAGIQLSAFHETDNTVVTTPTQMLNGLIFNAKSLGKVQQMYRAIGNIVDQELTYILNQEQHNIPELVRALNTQPPDGSKDSNGNKLTPGKWYEQNRDKLLDIFHNIMQNKVAKDDKDEFTLEGLIVNMFNSKDMPFDDPQIFHSAIAELTNYLTKTGIRTKFDGLFAVLHPASEFMQVREVQGGYMPVKTDEGGYTTIKLEPGETRVLQPAEFADYKALNEHLIEHHNIDPTNTPEFKEWFNGSKVVDKEGKPLLVYHGSPNKFDKFNDLPTWFTSSRESAQAYSAGEHPDLTKSQYIQLIHEYEEKLKTNLSPQEKQSTEKALKELTDLRDSGDVHEAYLNIQDPTKITAGYTPGETHYVVDHPNQIKSLNDDRNALDNAEKIRKHAQTHQYTEPRNLKGQQVTLNYADGTKQALSYDDDSEQQLIPEARALDLIRSKVDEYKKQLDDSSYIQLSDKDKIAELQTKHKQFSNDLEELRTIRESDNELSGWSQRSDNNYEVSSKGDARFSALTAKFKPKTIIDGKDVGGRTIESVYQTDIKRSGKGRPPSKDSIVYNPSLKTSQEQEDYSYSKGYKPLWDEWAKQNPTLIKELRDKSKGKTLTDQFANTRVSQARALSDILNESNKLKHPEIAHVLDNYVKELQGILKTSIKRDDKEQSIDDIKPQQSPVGDPYKFSYENFSQSKKYRDGKIKRLERDKTAEGVKQLLIAKEHEYLDKLNNVGLLYTGRLQKFLDEASNGYIGPNGQVSYIPQSLQNPDLFENAHKTQNAKVEVSRAECIAPIVARQNFLLQEGDTVGSITKDLIKKRLLKTLDYFKTDADGVIISQSGRKIFLHTGSEGPNSISIEEHPNVGVYFTNGKSTKWFTNDSGDRLFQVPTGMTVSNTNNELHIFLNNKYQIQDNPLIQNLNNGLGRQLLSTDSGNIKDTYNILIFDKDRQAAYNKAVIGLEDRAQKMFTSWQVYLDKLIGTRVPGQHFQSFQGMKIVGFAEGNHMHVPNSVIKLSGAD